MRMLSGYIRIITGTGIMMIAAMIYLMNREKLVGSDPIDVTFFGITFNATPQQVIIGLIFAGVVGAMIELLGIFTILRKPKSADK